jgi:zinc protease
MRKLFLIVLLASQFSFAASSKDWKIPTELRKLPNGLRVVFSEDHSSPTFAICISYGIGFRLEPEGRTGFAHLFEHMTFQGTPNAPKGVLDRVVQSGGGLHDGYTRSDFTNYFVNAPTSAFEPVLWLESDIMKGLDFTEENFRNQKDVVEEEVRLNVLNQPYGGFYWIDLQRKAYDTFPNSHNWYGEFKDLEAATLEDVKRFFEQYYAPNNAVIAISGDLNAEEVFSKVEKYFGSIPARKVPALPDVSEPAQTGERRETQKDSFAKLPAIAIGYRMPSRISRDTLVGALVSNLLLSGESSRLYLKLVKDAKIATDVSGGVNWPLGTAFDFNGPTLFTSLVFYADPTKEAELIQSYDSVISELAQNQISSEELARVRNKFRSDWYSELERPIFRAATLATTTLFDGDPSRVNKVADEIKQITPEDIQTFVRKYMIRSNRTIISRVPDSTKGEKQ